MSQKLASKIKEESYKQGFVLAGITTPDPPHHLTNYLDWISAGRHATMGYLAEERTRARRANPKLILPEAESILLLAAPYPNPKLAPAISTANVEKGKGKISAYAWNDDYHITLKEKLIRLIKFIEREVDHKVPNRWYTDTGPILEKDLAQRAGLGWMGRNTCLINPQIGSFFFLAEIFLGIKLPSDEPFTADYCGTCTRCLDACPTKAILPNRTIDANLCISYLTIENKGDIPEDLRPNLGNLIFGCDICQEVCPWNKKTVPERKATAFEPEDEGRIDPHPNLIKELTLTPQEFNKKFKNNPVKRAKRRGYLRNVAVALGNTGGSEAVPALEKAKDDIEPLVRTHAEWALRAIKSKGEKC